jgi:pyrroloquinoline quinone biosynthesis protein E
MSLSDIWDHSDAFNKFRGFDWMQTPCRDCPEKTRDFGGCRCQAYLLTGDMNATDPVCSLSPQRQKLQTAIEEAAQATLNQNAQPLVFRNSRNSKALSE